MSSDPTQDHQPDPSSDRPSDQASDRSKPTKPESNSELRHEMVERARQALEAIPEMIGPYHVIERLGAGGMGEVYRANQKSPIRRQVAVKLIKLGMDTRQVVARFEAERQALAMMDHPNIAKVFDGGTTADGRPYFVMEYVKGVPFTEYCDTAKLPLRERLKLFVPVCQAVQHAHQKGIVHRDLKPSNILICLYDGLPVPKVIDFGLAKALYQPLTDQSIYTTHGVMVGTPLYMSPEQAEQNNLDIDTRTDIYSLGVILYELLTGSTPLEREQLRAAAQHEVLRLIKEVDPPKPSTRLSGSASLPSVAAQRGIDPRQLSRSVSGDLDWIVMKALEKERSRRYDTAIGFARDIERFLNDEAVEACPPSIWYRFAKVRKKHRGKFTLAVLLLISQTIIAMVALYGWRQSHIAKQFTENQLEQFREDIDQSTVDMQNRSILDAIGKSPDRPGEEQSALLKWSKIADDDSKLKVLRFAFQDPLTASRIATRSESVIQACISLSPSRREKALGFLGTVQRQSESDIRIRVAALCLSLELDSEDLPVLNEAISWIVDHKDAPLSERLLELLNEHRLRIPPSQAISICKRLKSIVRDSRGKGSVPNSVSRSLATLSSTLSSVEKLSVFSTILDAMERGVIPSSVSQRTLSSIIESETESNFDAYIPVLMEYSLGAIEGEQAEVAVAILLSMILDRAESKSGMQCQHLIDLMRDSRSEYVIAEVDPALEKAWSRVEEDSLRAYVKQLLWILEFSKQDESRIAAIHNLAVLLPRLNTDEAKEFSDYFTSSLKVTPWKLWVQEGIVQSASALSVSLSDIACQDLIEQLIETLRKDNLNKGRFGTEVYTLQACSNAIGDFAARFKEQQVEQLATAMEAVVAIPDWPGDVPDLGACAAIVARNAGTERKMKIWKTSLSVTASSYQWAKWHVAEASLKEIAGSAIGEDADQYANDLLEALEARRNEPHLMQCFLLLAEKLSEEKKRECVIRLLSMSPRASGSALGYMADAIFSLMAKFPPEERHEFLLPLRECLEVSLDTKNEHTYRSISKAVSGLTESEMELFYGSMARGLDEDLTMKLISMVTLANSCKRLSGKHWQRLRDSAIETAKWNMHSDLAEGFPQCFSRILGRCNPDEVGELIASCRPSVNQNCSAWPLLILASKVDRGATNSMAHAELLGFLDRLANGELNDNWEFFGDQLREREVALPLIMMATTPTSVISALAHPGCIGQPREWLLQRLDELVYYEGRRILLLPPTEIGAAFPEVFDLDAERRGDEPVGTSEHLEHRPEIVRHFSCILDVMNWADKNLPDMDLEAVSNVTTR